MFVGVGWSFETGKRPGPTSVNCLWLPVSKSLTTTIFVRSVINRWPQAWPVSRPARIYFIRNVYKKPFTTLTTVSCVPVRSLRSEISTENKPDLWSFLGHWFVSLSDIRHTKIPNDAGFPSFSDSSSHDGNIHDCNLSSSTNDERLPSLPRLAQRNPPVSHRVSGRTPKSCNGWKLVYPIFSINMAVSSNHTLFKVQNSNPRSHPWCFFSVGRTLFMLNDQLLAEIGIAEPQDRWDHCSRRSSRHRLCDLF